MPATHHARPLAALGALRIRGSDASAYLQGQLSGDLHRAVAGHISYSGLHNAQGRVLARLQLAKLAEGDWLAILPASLVDATAAGLRRFVLRSKLTIESAPAGAIALPATAAAAAGAAAALPRDSVTLRWPDGRELLYCPEGATGEGPASEDPAATSAQRALDWRDWQARELQLGLAEVYPETSGMFVAQMLNFDCIGAIAFDKGCYTGQEVIARAHYRGRMKRRLQRFAAAAPLGLAPGASLRLADGRSALLVRAITLADGSCELLAVCALPGTVPPGAPDEPAPGDAPGGGPTPVLTRALPLPYPLPE